MSAPIDAGRVAYLTVNAAVVVFLLLPIAIIAVFALNQTPYIAFPPVGVSLRWFAKRYLLAHPELAAGPHPPHDGKKKA